MDNSEVKVAGICGSLRNESYSRKAMNICLDAARDNGAGIERIYLDRYEFDVFNPDQEVNDDMEQLKRYIRESDSIILSTPMYHGSYSSPMKTALDYCGFEEFEDKTVGLMGVSGGSFPITALEHLRTVCRALNAWVIPHQAAIPNVSSEFQDGELDNKKIRDRLEKLGVRAVEYSDISPEPSTFESSQNRGAE